MSSNQQSSSTSNTSGGQSNQAYAGEKPYTAGEKTWVKENYGGEFKFLLGHGLKIYNEEDREEGRAIARAFMEDDKQGNGK